VLQKVIGLFLVTSLLDKNRLKVGHTCNVTAHRNAVTLQVTDTIRSYDLNFHPVPHGATASVTPWGSQFVTGARSIMNVKKARGEDGGDVSRCTSKPAPAVNISSL
jgi:hypothetical protein